MQWIELMGLCMVNFSVGYKNIPEKAMVIPQYQHTLVEDEYYPPMRIPCLELLT